VQSGQTRKRVPAKARRSGGGSASDGGEGPEPRWWEWLEERPVGALGAGVVAAGWVALALLTLTGIWPLEVTFFLAVGLLTFVLGCLSLFAAAVHVPRRAQPPQVLQLPGWLKGFEEYFRWLTPVAFLVGLIFAHYYWH